MGETDDKTIISSVRDGNYESFSALYSKWVSPLYRFVCSLIKSEQITQDIVQEAFVKIWSGRESLNPEYSFKAYLFTISYHLVLKEMKRQLNNPLMDDYMEYCNNERLTANPDAEEKLDFDRFLTELRKAKEKLTPRQRQIFEMNKEDNSSIAEIATTLSLTEQSVRNQLSAALKIIRKELGDYSFLLALFAML